MKARDASYLEVIINHYLKKSLSDVSKDETTLVIYKYSIADQQMYLSASTLAQNEKIMICGKPPK